MFDSDLITNPYKTYAHLRTAAPLHWAALSISTLMTPKLRESVDRRLSAILMDDEFGIISSSDAVVIEASGSITQRLRILEKAVTSSV